MLYNVGVGPIRGFAVTLMIGIVTSVFTAFFVSRLLFHFLLKNERSSKQFAGRDAGSQNLKPRLRGKYSRPALALSAVADRAGLLAFSVLRAGGDTMLGLDFTGGANLRMVVLKDADDSA